MNYRSFLLAGVTAGIGLAAYAAGLSQEILPYRTALWDMTAQPLGHHRIVLSVAAENMANGVAAVIPWRRRDADPERKALLLFDVAGNRVRNLLVRSLNREKAEIVFEPAAGAGNYYLYFLPFPIPQVWTSPPGNYLPFTSEFDPAWARQNQLQTIPLTQLPQARVEAMEAVDDFQRFDPMEVCATAAETAALAAECPEERSFMVFPEPRERSIRMRRDIPVDWVVRGEAPHFSAVCRPGENFAFQLGVWAVRGAVSDLTPEAGNFVRADGATLPKELLQCLNTGGIDYHGEAFTRRVDVPAGMVQPLWLFLTVPEDAAGRYTGTVALHSADGGSAEIAVTLEVAGELLADGGVDHPERMTRLGWFNSTAGEAATVLPPYQPLRFDGDTVQLLNRSVTFGADALPVSIISNGRELLQSPVEFRVVTDAGPVAFSGWQLVWERRSETAADFHAAGHAPEGTLHIRGRLEYDGWLDYELRFLPARNVDIADIRLELPMTPDTTPYAMGFGRKGSKRPDTIRWHWEEAKASNALWLGDIDAGLQLRLNPATAVFDPSGTLYEAGLPEGWYNEGHGGAEVAASADAVRVDAFTGPRRLAAEQPLEFGFRLLVTPFKPVDWRSHWATRRGGWPGIPGNNMRNLFHGVRGNKYINYPFCDPGEMRYIVDSLRRNQYNNDCTIDGKLAPADVEIYYTLREISSRAWELWAMRSLGTEIFAPSAFVYSIHSAHRITASGGGYPYLVEHLEDNYIPAWMQPLDANTVDGPLNQIDAAIATRGDSRLANYYVESIGWLLRNFAIRGLYLDGIGYDRVILRRAAQVMANERPDYRINFHAMDNFDWSHTETGNLSLHMEHLPFLSDLWLGEMYDYSAAPDYWLTEISGLPFGLTGEQLNGSNAGNFFRGMLYGMNWRKDGSSATTAIWQLWDSFGIANADMYGYWLENSPVRADNPEVKITTYRNPDTRQALVVLAHWTPEPAKQIRIPRLNAAFTIDGDLTDAGWQQAARMVQFYQINSALDAPDPFVFYLACDDKMLYFAFESPGNPTPRADRRERDGRLWEDDSVDILIAPDYREKPTDNYHWIGNADGVIYDAYRSDPGWNGRWQYRAQRSSDGWSGEGAIPLAELGITPEMLASGTVGINFGQTRHLPETRACSYTKTHGRFDTAYAPLSSGTAANREEPRVRPASEAMLEIDYAALGFDPARIHAYYPDLPGIQPGGEADPAQPVRFAPDQGVFLILEER